MNREEALEKALELHRSGKLEEARELYTSMLRLRPRDPSSLHLLGLTYLDESNWREGADLIQRAIALEPSQHLFHYNLGVAWRNHGQFDAAKACFRRAIELKDDYGEAWGAWTATQRYSESGEDMQHIQRQLEQPLQDENRAFFEFAAGKISDDTGRYAQAFEHYTHGNELLAGTWRAEDYAEMCNGIKQTFSKQFIDERRDWGLAGAKPIFIVGMPRSGTSLAEQILAGHSGVFGAGEVGDILGIIDAMGKRMKPPQPYPRFVPFLPKKLFSGFAETYMKRLAGLAGETSRMPLNKMPSNYLHLGLIRIMFPEAKIIHSRRHPLDTCLSCYFQNFSNGHVFTRQLDTLANYFLEYRRMMDHWNNIMPGEIFDLEYESLVQQPEQTVRNLLSFCDLPWEDVCLDFNDNDRRVSTASSWQVRQPLYSRSIGRWRHYEQQLQPLIERIGL